MEMTLKVWEHGDAVSACLAIPMLPHIGGALRIVVTLTSRQVIEALHRAGFEFSKQKMEHIGSLFGGIGKFLKKVAKSSVMKFVMKIGKAVIDNPLVKMVAPQVALAVASANMAAKLIHAARGKDPKKAAKAKVAIAAARQQSEKEQAAGKPLPLPPGIANRHPLTQGAFRYMVNVDRATAA